MAAGRLLLPGWMPAVDSNGDPIPNAKVYFYYNKTTTLAPVFADEALSLQIANPVEANATGRFPAVWADSEILYSAAVEAPYGPAGVPFSYDNLSSSLAAEIVLTEAAEAAADDAEVAYQNVLDAIQTAQDADGDAALAGAIAGQSAGAAAANLVVGDKAAKDGSNVEADAFRGAIGAAPTSGSVSVRDFGAVADGITDDSAAIQAAINTGKPVLFPAGTYRANNLTQTVNSQRLFADGTVRIQKNTNGPILTSSGNDAVFFGLDFRGESAAPAYTGDNIVITGNNALLDRCGSMWAFGRAVRATGNALRIFGSCSVYQTADAAGFDIEIGQTGVATLYHVLTGFRSSQSGGGIKLVDTGAHMLTDCQFGKLHIAAGTRPAGSGGGMTSNCRILGSVTVELSGANFTTNQFSDVAITFAAGTSGCTLDQSNSYGASATVTNNGNGNNVIIRAASTGGTIGLKYGADAVASEFGNLPSGGGFYSNGGFRIGNNRFYSSRNAAGTADIGLLALNPSDNVSLGHTAGSNSLTLISGTGGIGFFTSGATQFQVVSGAIRPGTSGATQIGTSTLRFSRAFLQNINATLLAVHADNAAATTAGLAVGEFYRTITGQVMVVF